MQPMTEQAPMIEPRKFQTLSYRCADNGVAFIAIDVKDKPVNVLTPELHREIGAVAALLAADDKAIGAVIHSGKPSFMAGGDLNRIVRYYDQQRTPEEAYLQSRTYTESLRRLETCGKPVAVAINGTALGGGLELALACHYRVVADDPDIQLGLPEVSLGLLPGGGGTQRLPRLIGLKQAAALILSGERISPGKALELGIVHTVAPAAGLVELAEQWVLGGGEPHQPWDRKGFRVPGGAGLNDMNVGRLFQQLTAKVSAEYRHNYPAPIAALRCLFNGTTVASMDQALEIESREFSALTRDPVARNMIRTLFLNTAKINLKELLAEPGTQLLKQRCEAAYIQQGVFMATSGIKPALIENAAFAAGFPVGPLALASAEPGQYATNREVQDFTAVKQGLLCSQALAAAECWEEGVTEPVKADLASHFGWGFPSYTGGVMSYIDTLGLRGFISLCDEFSSRYDAGLNPSKWLRARAGQDDRVYPTLA
jgi:3-hydroxyacyl-CoA dehydrogenase/enoyl-CoA hydratase/3-hydroxybutyryl-CoA epimerase